VSAINRIAAEGGQKKLRQVKKILLPKMGDNLGPFLQKKKKGIGQKSEIKKEIAPLECQVKKTTKFWNEMYPTDRSLIQIGKKKRQYKLF